MTDFHRKQKVTYNEPGHAHFLTYSCRRRWPLLSKDRSRQWVIDAIIEARVSAQAKEYLLATGNNDWLKRLTVLKGRREVFQFWLPGGGYDHNMWNERPIFEVIDYIHGNPIRRGLADKATDWLWSSARFWEGDHSGPLEMDPIIL